MQAHHAAATSSGRLNRRGTGMDNRHSFDESQKWPVASTSDFDDPLDAYRRAFGGDLFAGVLTPSDHSAPNMLHKHADQLGSNARLGRRCWVVYLAVGRFGGIDPKHECNRHCPLASGSLQLTIAYRSADGRLSHLPIQLIDECEDGDFNDSLYFQSRHIRRTKSSAAARQ